MVEFHCLHLMPAEEWWLKLQTETNFAHRSGPMSGLHRSFYVVSITSYTTLAVCAPH